MMEIGEIESKVGFLINMGSLSFKNQGHKIKSKVGVHRNGNPASLSFS